MTLAHERGLATDSHWFPCGACGELLYAKRWRRNSEVCPECGDHGRLDARTRIDLLVDPGSFRDLVVVLPDHDPLRFIDRRPYPDRLREAQQRTGEREAVVCGTGSISGRPLALAVMDFRFLGGSLGTGVGERLVLLAEHALDQRLPFLVVTASGGARMQEGALSLLQMAKVSQAIARLHEAGLLVVTLVTDPTFGGVAASFATQADVIIAEPGARLGFAGPRVIRDTLRTTLPEGFQTAEFVLAHGAIDMVVQRIALREVLGRLVRVTAPVRAVRDPGPADTVPDTDELTERSAWEVVKLARNADRPTGREYIGLITEWFVELHGDRQSADSPSIVGGIAQLGRAPVVMVVTQKGHTTQELVGTNFGMAGPGGYRKALRLFRLAEKLRLPVVTLVDTPGAFPGIEAEEHGQAAAIAANIMALTGLDVPVVSVITGEGGSGGALALAVADRVLMLENSVYSVISPEGCAAILWEAGTAAQAADALQLTAGDLVRLGVVDGIVAEPSGGAQTDPAGAADTLRAVVCAALAELADVPAGQLVPFRRERLRRIGTPDRTRKTMPA